eukprot:8953962-Karenia_brevis.AAC.1
MLVAPIFWYGTELFTYEDHEAAEVDAVCSSSWKRLLHIGSRAPSIASWVCTDVQPCSLEWRVRRLGLFFDLSMPHRTLGSTLH